MTERESKWQYTKLPSGYLRTYAGLDNSYMYKVLGDKSNRSTRPIWKRILDYVICSIESHVLDEQTCIGKGYTNDNGAYYLTLCKRCRAKVIFYEKGERWNGLSSSM